MRKVLVLDEGWLEYRSQFANHEIQLVVKDRATHEGVDAMIIPAHAWPVAPSRKYHAPIVAYGTREEIRELINEPGIGYLVDQAALDLESIVTALRALWREGGEGSTGEELRGEDMFEHAKLTPRERETARQMLQGKSREETARAMKISEATVRAFRSSIFLKTGVKNAAELQAKLGR